MTEKEETTENKETADKKTKTEKKGNFFAKHWVKISLFSLLGTFVFVLALGSIFMFSNGARYMFDNDRMGLDRGDNHGIFYGENHDRSRFGRRGGGRAFSARGSFGKPMFGAEMTEYMSKGIFEGYDSDKDGSLSESEFSNFIEESFNWRQRQRRF